MSISIVDKKISVLLVGLGRIGYSKNENGNLSLASHFGAILGNENFELVCVCDTRKKLLNEITEKFSIFGYTSLKQISPDQNFDLIVVASPTETHFEVVKEALRFGPKMLFIEKPLTEFSHQASEIIKLCSENKVEISVNFSRRFSNLYKNLYKKIQSRCLNKKILLHTKFTGTIQNNGIHFIDLALYYFGSPEQIEVLKTKAGETKSFTFTYPKLNAEVIFVSLGNLSASVEEIDLFIDDNRFMIDNFEVKKRSKVPDKKFPGFNLFGEDEQILDDSYDALVLAYNNISDWFLFGSKLLSPAKNTKLINRIIKEYLNE